MACNTARAVKSPLECDGTTADAQEGFHAVSETTVPELIERRADEQPDDTAYTFVDYESDPAGVAESLTWSELRDRVEVVAETLAYRKIFDMTLANARLPDGDMMALGAPVLA